MMGKKQNNFAVTFLLFSDPCKSHPGQGVGVGEVLGVFVAVEMF